MPASAQRVVYGTHVVTALVRNQDGTPLSGKLVQFSGFGGVSSCQTDGFGACSISYGGPAFPRTDVISGCVDSLCDTSQNQWILPTSTLGSSDGSGQILPPGPSSVKVVDFEFSASGQLKGKCLIKDVNTGTTFRCVDIIAYVQSGPHTFFYGHGTANGVTQTYRMDVNDGGESRGAVDTFALVTDLGYALAGTVVKGNLQVRGR